MLVDLPPGEDVFGSRGCVIVIVIVIIIIIIVIIIIERNENCFLSFGRCVNDRIAAVILSLPNVAELESRRHSKRLICVDGECMHSSCVMGDCERKNTADSNEDVWFHGGVDD